MGGMFGIGQEDYHIRRCYHPAADQLYPEPLSSYNRLVTRAGKYKIISRLLQWPFYASEKVIGMMFQIVLKLDSGIALMAVSCHHG